MNDLWKGKKVLITGVCGTVGGELVQQLRSYGCSEIIGIDNNETEMFFISQKFNECSNIEFFLCDMRDREGLIRVTRGMDIILHAAALKHVILCEKSPRDAVSTNIDGMMNIIDAAQINGVERVIFTSTDKAVNPTNVMGTTKLIGERLITAANAHRRHEHDTIFASTRFGNVLGSRGSVIPVFKKQIKNGGPVTLTNVEMTRFIMTLRDAVSLVLDSTFMARGGDVFVTKMPVIRIADLAELMIEILAPQYGYNPEDISINIIGSKPGEKMYEELLSDEEVHRTIELEQFYAIIPAFKGIYHSINYDYDSIINQQVERPYNSAIETAMTRDELNKYIVEHQLLEEASV